MTPRSPQSPYSNVRRATPDRIASDAATWDPPNGIFLPAERRSKGIDKTALCVQITLCIVVAALLFSVIALPKLRASAVRIEDLQAPQPTAAGR